MHNNQQGRTGDKDELQGPESDVRDWKVKVITDIGTTWLLSVAVKVLIVISPDFLCYNREPNTPKRCGVFVHSPQEVFQTRPIHLNFLISFSRWGSG
uniref:Uncharacterized protein n=1 Tax=Pseudonaja textilis TaxID=8673 RepID=A0A670Y7U2_PSETE